MDGPSISSDHLARLKSRFPYAFYVWNRGKGCYQLWCDERRGIEPYKFMDLLGPEGQYREPGEWVIDALRRTDPDTGEYQVGTKAGRQTWVQSLMDESYLEKLKEDRKNVELEQMRNSARWINGHGRVWGSQQRTAKQYHMKRKLGG